MDHLGWGEAVFSAFVANQEKWFYAEGLPLLRPAEYEDTPSGNLACDEMFGLESTAGW